MPRRSTRLSIVERSLEDILVRLGELPATAKVRELRNKARAYENAVKSWPLTPPTEEQRGTMMKLVLELNLEVMAEGKAAAGRE
jgi:hypothetical protein